MRSLPIFSLLMVLVAPFLVVLTLPFWCRFCLRFGWVDHPGNRKIHDRPMPLAGGMALGTALIVSLALGLFVTALGLVRDGPFAELSPSWGPRPVQWIIIAAGAGGMLGLGLWDDKYELSAGRKFGGQLLIAILVAAGGIRTNLFGPNQLFNYGLSVLWILTVTNAFNLLDNMNGLCAGIAAIASGIFGALAAAHGEHPVSVFGYLVMAASLGFLPFNYPRARAFLGDAGSHLLGYLVAVAALLPHLHQPPHAFSRALLSPLLVLAVPLADLVWVMAFRICSHRPFYIGDTNHLSHRLVQAGLSPAWAVALLWAMAAGMGALACLLVGSAGR